MQNQNGGRMRVTTAEPSYHTLEHDAAHYNRRDMALYTTQRPLTVGGKADERPALNIDTGFKAGVEQVRAPPVTPG